MAHVPLEVEVGELVLLRNPEESSEGLVWDDPATVRGVLQVVLADVGVDLASHLGPGHLDPMLLAKEVSKLRCDRSRLDKATRCPWGTSRTLLLVSLLSSPDLLLSPLLECPKLGLELGDRSAKACESVKGHCELIAKRRLPVLGTLSDNNVVDLGWLDDGLGLLGLAL